MKKIYSTANLAIIGIAIFLFSCFIRTPQTFIECKEAQSEEAEDAVKRAAWETARLADPATGRIPAGMREKELAFAANLPKMQSNSAIARMSNTSFSYRGPVNMGGRTRAFAIDINNENIVLAGSVNGGMYRSTDGGQTWTRVSPMNTDPAVTWVVQDKRTGHTNTWYYSTGEIVGASGSGAYAYYLGNGIWKSNDNGITWSQLTATSSNTPAVFDNVWDLISKVVTDPSVSTSEVAYAATYGAIYRTANGGTSWTKVIGSTSAYSYFTDVDVTTTGIVYAYLSSDGATKGIYRRETTGVLTNINPPGWDTGTYNRVVIGINPSNENEVYFLGETPNMGKQTTNYKGDIEWTSLWKYTYVSGNGSGAGGIWTDLSANIPYTGTQMGNFNSQGGYDLIVRVHPAHPNIVYIGGTNLFRSDDGFTTSTMISHIGGYDSLSTIPYYTNYPNHHSDQHNIVFLPSNPDVMYQTNDGGLYKTNDDRAYPVVWQDLNNGYNTSQFYSIALDHGGNNDIVIGGTQDNGTWFTNSASAAVPWTHPGMGDGGYCAIDNGHNNYYMTRQEGKLTRHLLDANGNVLSFGRIDPIDSVDYLFINPFVLDPNNNDIMYWVAGNHVWRNDSLTHLPTTGVWDSISTGWYRLPDSITTTGTYVTALGISTTPANRLYVGTSKKELYRMDNANTSTPTTTNITNSLFNANGYINCVAVDPSNADNILVVFSNYQIYSLFYSNDGGTTFSKVAGNLEVNSSGTGNGPSLRWAQILPTANGTVYLVAASTGLYGTNTLNGLNTVWTELAPNEIGNLVVDQIDARTSDGYVVVGTHGAGAFSAIINDTLSTGVASVAQQLHFSISPNPATDFVNVSFDKTKGLVSKLKMFDVNGKLINEKSIDINYGGEFATEFSTRELKSGTYFIAIINGSAVKVEKVVVEK